MANFAFYIDWNNDGDWSDAHENVTADVIECSWSIGMGEPHQLVADETRLTMVLKNSDRKYSPENAASVIYPNLVPQRRIRVQAVHNATTYTLWIGWVEQIQPQAFINADKTTTIIGVGAKQWLQNSPVKLQNVTNRRSDEVIADLLGTTILPPAAPNVWLLGIEGASELDDVQVWDVSVGSNLDTGAVTFAYIGDQWDQNTTAYNAIYDVMDAERGRFFFNRNGEAVFWNRRHLYNVTTLNATITDGEMIDAIYAYGEDLINEVTCSASPKKLTSDVVLWTLEGESITVSAGQTKEFRVRYRDPVNETATVFATRAEVTQFVWSRGANFSYYLKNSGNSGTLMIENRAKGGRLATAVTIRGDALTTYNKIEVQAVDGLSRATYGTRHRRIDGALIESELDARAIAEYELYRRNEPRGMFREVSMLPKNDAMATTVLANSIGAYVRVQDTQLAHDKYYFLMGERHEWRVGNLHTCHWILEDADINHYWTLGVAGLSELDTTARLGL